MTHSAQGIVTLGMQIARGSRARMDDRATRTAVGRAKAGNDEAFAALFRRYERELRATCRRLLGDDASVEDALSEVYLRARRAMDGFDAERPFRPWLVTIAGNYCIDELRRRAREARVFDTEEPEEALESPAPSPLGRLLAARERQALEAALAKLPLRYRVPLLLRYFEELDYEAIAKSIGVEREQVGTLLYRAKFLLRRELDGGVRRTRGGDGATQKRRKR